MKQYEIVVDAQDRYYIEAESENDARDKAIERFKEDHNCGFIDVQVESILEIDEDEDGEDLNVIQKVLCGAIYFTALIGGAIGTIILGSMGIARAMYGAHTSSFLTVILGVIQAFALPVILIFLVIPIMFGIGKGENPIGESKNENVQKAEELQ